LISDLFWLVYLVVPGFLIYQIWTNFVAPALATNTSGTGPVGENAKQRKMREKYEKKKSKLEQKAAARKN
jgi:cytoskeletal protein RodZ